MFTIYTTPNALPDEKDSEQLRDFYGNAYYQIGITDSEERRRENLDQLFKSEDLGE